MDDASAEPPGPGDPGRHHHHDQPHDDHAGRAGGHLGPHDRGTLGGGGASHGGVLAGLATAVEELLAAEVDSLDDDGLHSAVVGLCRLRSRLAAVSCRFVDRWDARRVWASDGSKAPGARLARDACCDVASARAVVRRAQKLRSMPHTRAAFEAGRLSVDHVDVLARANTPSRAAAFAVGEDQLVDEAGRLSYPEFARAVRYWGDLADDHGAEDRAARDHAGRRLHASVTLGGTVDIAGRLDPLGGAVFREELLRLERQLFEADWAAALARLGPDATVTVADLARTPEQRRADALVEMAERSAAMPADARRLRPLVTVLVDYPTLAGRVCELFNGGIVVTPGQVAGLLSRADVERIVFGPDSRVLDVGVRARFFTGATRRAVEVRDRTCTFPGCDVPAVDCHVDHITEHHVGGETTQDNGRLLCPRHNHQRPGHPGNLHGARHRGDSDDDDPDGDDPAGDDPAGDDDSGPDGAQDQS